MPGLILPPTRLRLGTSDTYQSGDLTLQPGTAITGKRTGKSLQIDGDAPDGQQPSGLFIPTPAALTDVAVFNNLRSSAATRLGYLELNLLAAAAAADATNNLAVQVRDAFGAAVILPMSSTARHFAFDGTVADRKVYKDPVGSGAGAGRCYWNAFSPTADVTVTAAQFGMSYITNNGNGYSKVYEITDANGNVLTQTDPFTAGVNTVDNTLGLPRLFQTAVTLSQGVTYYVGVRMLEQSPSQLNPGAQAGAPVGGTAPLGNNSVRSTTNAGLTFADSSVVNLGGTYQMHYALLGSTLGVRLSGTIHVDVIANGTGGTPGTGLNVRMLWNQSS